MSESPPRGQRAYETGAAAMSFNHNTIGFEICPAAPGQAAIVSPSPLEANVSLLGRIATTRKGGIYNFDKLTSGNDPSTLKFRLSGRYAASQGCKMVYRSVDNPARYFATTFSSLLESNGIRVIGSSRASSGNTNAGNSADDDSQPSGKELSGPPPVGYRLLYTHLSKPLELVVRDLNHYSNNFVAEQLLYALGDTPVGLSRMQGLRQLEEYLVSLGVPIEHFTLRDASGLSHDNRLTTAALATVIRDAYHDPEVRASFVASLPIAGRSGTVKSRYAGWDAAAVHAKSGTLRDVVSVAGIVFSRKGHRYAFAVINNKVRAKNRALKFQESVLSVLVEH